MGKLTKRMIERDYERWARNIEDLKAALDFGGGDGDKLSMELAWSCLSLIDGFQRVMDGR